MPIWHYKAYFSHISECIPLYLNQLVFTHSSARHYSRLPFKPLIISVPDAHVVIVVVVGGGDLDGSGAEVHFDVVVGHHHHLPLRDERMHQLLPDERCVP